MSLEPTTNLSGSPSRASVLFDGLAFVVHLAGPQHRGYPPDKESYTRKLQTVLLKRIQRYGGAIIGVEDKLISDATHVIATHEEQLLVRQARAAQAQGAEVHIVGPRWVLACIDIGHIIDPTAPAWNVLPGPPSPGLPGFKEHTNLIRVSRFPEPYNDLRALLRFWIEAAGGQGGDSTPAALTSHIVVWDWLPLSPEQQALQQRHPHIRHVPRDWLVRCIETWTLLDDLPYCLLPPEEWPAGDLPNDHGAANSDSQNRQQQQVQFHQQRGQDTRHEEAAPQSWGEEGREGGGGVGTDWRRQQRQQGQQGQQGGFGYMEEARGAAEEAQKEQQQVLAEGRSSGQQRLVWDGGVGNCPERDEEGGRGGVGEVGEGRGSGGRDRGLEQQQPWQQPGSDNSCVAYSPSRMHTPPPSLGVQQPQPQQQLQQLLPPPPASAATAVAQPQQLKPTEARRRRLSLSAGREKLHHQQQQPSPLGEQPKAPTRSPLSPLEPRQLSTATANLNMTLQPQHHQNRLDHNQRQHCKQLHNQHQTRQPASGTCDMEGDDGECDGGVCGTGGAGIDPEAGRGNGGGGLSRAVSGLLRAEAAPVEATTTAEAAHGTAASDAADEAMDVDLGAIADPLAGGGGRAAGSDGDGAAAAVFDVLQSGADHNGALCGVGSDASAEPSTRAIRRAKSRLSNLLPALMPSSEDDSYAATAAASVALMGSSGCGPPQRRSLLLLVPAAAVAVPPPVMAVACQQSSGTINPPLCPAPDHDREPGPSLLPPPQASNALQATLGPLSVSNIADEAQLQQQQQQQQQQQGAHAQTAEPMEHDRKEVTSGAGRDAALPSCGGSGSAAGGGRRGRGLGAWMTAPAGRRGSSDGTAAAATGGRWQIVRPTGPAPLKARPVAATGSTAATKRDVLGPYNVDVDAEEERGRRAATAVIEEEDEEQDGEEDDDYPDEVRQGNGTATLTRESDGSVAEGRRRLARRAREELRRQATAGAAAAAVGVSAVDKYPHHQQQERGSKSEDGSEEGEGSLGESNRWRRRRTETTETGSREEGLWGGREEELEVGDDMGVAEAEEADHLQVVVHCYEEVVVVGGGGDELQGEGGAAAATAAERARGGERGSQKQQQQQQQPQDPPSEAAADGGGPVMPPAQPGPVAESAETAAAVAGLSSADEGPTERPEGGRQPHRGGKERSAVGAGGTAAAALSGGSKRRKRAAEALAADTGTESAAAAAVTATVTAAVVSDDAGNVGHHEVAACGERPQHHALAVTGAPANGGGAEGSVSGGGSVKEGASRPAKQRRRAGNPAAAAAEPVRVIEANAGGGDGGSAPPSPPQQTRQDQPQQTQQGKVKAPRRRAHAAAAMDDVDTAAGAPNGVTDGAEAVNDKCRTTAGRRATADRDKKKDKQREGDSTDREGGALSALPGRKAAAGGTRKGGSKRGGDAEVPVRLDGGARPCKAGQQHRSAGGQEEEAGGDGCEQEDYVTAMDADDGVISAGADREGNDKGCMGGGGNGGDDGVHMADEGPQVVAAAATEATEARADAATAPPAGIRRVASKRGTGGTAAVAASDGGGGRAAACSAKSLRQKEAEEPPASAAAAGSVERKQEVVERKCSAPAKGRGRKAAAAAVGDAGGEAVGTEASCGGGGGGREAEGGVGGARAGGTARAGRGGGGGAGRRRGSGSSREGGEAERLPDGAVGISPRAAGADSKGDGGGDGGGRGGSIVSPRGTTTNTTSTAATTTKLVFALSGFSADDRGRYGAMLKALRLSYIPVNSDWDARINALLAPSLKRSDKTVCALAAGAWLLHSDYLAACQRAAAASDEAGGGGGSGGARGAAAVDPAAYEFRECEDGPSVISPGAPAHWRQRCAARGGNVRAFTGLRLLVPPGLPPPLDSATLARMVTAGGGVAVTRGGAAAARGCHAGVVLADPKKEDKLIAALKAAGASVVSPAYVVEWVAHPSASLARHYCHGTVAGEALAALEADRGAVLPGGAPTGQQRAGAAGR